jgi:hypothetical protein
MDHKFLHKSFLSQAKFPHSEEGSDLISLAWDVVGTGIW